MKLIYMESTINIMSKVDVEILLTKNVVLKELKNGTKYLVIKTK
jgi:hypothetical protein